MLSSEHLVSWCQQTLPEDSGAFDLLVNRYWSKVFALAYRYMGNRQDAEDQTQEVFLKVYRNIGALEKPATLTAWIMRITVNTCYDALASQKHSPAVTSLMPSEAELHYTGAHVPTPEEAVLRAEMRDNIAMVLEQLDSDARQALVLCDIEGRSYQEIASLLALGSSAVKMRIHRARRAFQQTFITVDPEPWRGAQGKLPYHRAEATQRNLAHTLTVFSLPVSD